MPELVETQGGIREGSGSNNDLREVTLIRAGWGSSGYYSEEVLARDVPTAFPVGTHMYLDHPTVREDAERPERSVRDLVGTIVETPRMAGIDAVAVAEVFPHWKPVIDAVASEVGLSIRAMGEIEEGDAAGKSGPIVQALHSGLSVDYVTEAGAGGKVGNLIESAREIDKQEVDLTDKLSEDPAFIERVATRLQEKSGPGRSKKGGSMDPEKELRESQERVAQLEKDLTEEKGRADKAETRGDRAEDALRLNEAGSIVAKAVGEVKGLPTRAAVRAVESALRGDLPTDSEGRLDKDALTERATAKAKEEVEYLSEATGHRVEGFGESSSDQNGGSGSGSDKAEAEGEELLAEALKGLGMPESAAKIGAGGR